MKELIITPELATEAETRNKPAMCIISKMNVSFNMAATKRLVLKEGTMFQIILKDNKIFYKDVAASGFLIRTVNNKGANLINRGMHTVLCENYQKYDKSFRFEIGEFKDGMRELSMKEA
jgi:hypothetical protein